MERVEHKLTSLCPSACPMLSVGVLSANLLALGQDITRLEKAGVKCLHFDVMDGCFTPLMTMGVPLVKAIKTPLLKDVHLMVDNPFEKVDAFINAGADVVTVQLESCDDILPTLVKLRHEKSINHPNHPIVRGLSVLPMTPVEKIVPLLSDIDLLLLLTVDPRKPVMEPVPFDYYRSRYLQLKKIVREHNANILFCIDGGINKNNLAQYCELKPDIVVSGSAVFENNHIEENVHKMREVISGG